MSVHVRLTASVSLAALLAVVLVGCTSTGPTTTGSPTPTRSAAPAIPLAENLAVHSVAQEGLAIALASNVLQTQLALVGYAGDSGPQACMALPGGGSSNLSAFAEPSDDVFQLTANNYYDSACAQKYETSVATESSGSGDSAILSATTTYFAKSGSTLGTLVTSASASFDIAIALSGTGTFTSASGRKSSLGLACQGTSSDTVLDCQGGIAQDFSVLNHSLGSITPLVLTIGADVSDPITFTGSGRTTSTAALGALSVTAPGGTLALSGAASQPTAAVTTGQAGGFVLFPSTPTGWTVTDQANDVVFAISVTDNTTRTLAATVTTISTKKVLAKLSLDQSGTGTVSYLGQKAAPVTSWLLSS
jgi:hypothetical protein